MTKLSGRLGFFPQLSEPDLHALLSTELEPAGDSAAPCVRIETWYTAAAPARTTFSGLSSAAMPSEPAQSRASVFEPLQGRAGI